MHRKLSSVSRGDSVTVSSSEGRLEGLTVHRAKQEEDIIRMKGESYAYKIQESSHDLILINETKGTRVGEVQSLSVVDT